MIKFQEIDQFRHVIKNVTMKAQFVGLDEKGDVIVNRLAVLPKLTFEGTVKIHGCCSSVRIQGDKLTPQSRNQELTAEQDNYGFAKFIFNLPQDVWFTLKGVFGDNIVIHGEWAGKGIQDTVAVNQVERFWTIFRIQKIDENGEGGAWIDFSNVDLTSLNQFRVFSIRQFGVETVEIDFEKPADATNKINELSLAVEEECPVGKFFGISGIGEGRVWSCINDGYQSSKYVFKVKGQAHSKSKVKKLANVDVEKMKSIEDFVKMSVDEGRCQQAFDFLKLANADVNETLTGDFIRWIINDIIKEESDTISQNGLTLKEVSGAISKVARRWFLAKIS